MTEPSKKRPYHHGDLRAALLDAVGTMVEEAGVESVSVRGAARRVGVSHPAAFRHFADKKDLLTAFAARAAAHMAGEMEGLGARAPFLDVGTAYLKFAMQYPGEFRMIFRQELLNETDEQYQAQMQRLARTLSGSGKTIEKGQRLPLEAVLAWSATHGLASLYLDGSLRDELPKGHELDAMAEVLKLLGSSFNNADEKKSLDDVL